MSRVTHSAEETRALGARLARAILEANLEAPLTIALNGELGAGKTTLIGGLLHALGVEGPVRSPTYTLIEPYECKAGGRELTLHHLDLYRLASPRELEMLALRDLLVPHTVLLVEWAERGGDALPTPDLAISLSYGGATERTIEVTAITMPGKELAASLEA